MGGDGAEPAVGEPPGLTLTDGHDDVSAWENEGGRYATADVVGTTRSALEWLAFRERFFPDRRVHDFDAVKAYAAYRGRGPRPARLAPIP